MKREIKLSNADHRLLSIVWELEPIASPELCILAECRLGWKRTTTYTVLRRLCKKDILQNEETIVTSLIGQKQVQSFESKQILDRSFDGSLPKFVAAFLNGRQISKTDAEEIKQMIEQYRRDK